MNNITKEEQEEIDNKLVKEMLGNKFSCEDCAHVFTEKEIRYFIGPSLDNQKCPSCGYIIT